MLSESIKAEFRRLQLHPVNEPGRCFSDRWQRLSQGQPAEELASAQEHRRTMVSRGANGLA